MNHKTSAKKAEFNSWGTVTLFHPRNSLHKKSCLNKGNLIGSKLGNPKLKTEKKNPAYFTKTWNLFENTHGYPVYFTKTGNLFENTPGYPVYFTNTWNLFENTHGYSVYFTKTWNISNKI